MMQIKNIDKHFGGVYALEKCNLRVDKGKITALIGPNGSGKTTLFNTITSLVDSDGGEITFDRENITALKTHRVANKGISRTFQQVRLFSNLTIRDHLAIAMQNDTHCVSAFFTKEKIDEIRMKELLLEVGLEKPLDTLGSDLSYGQSKLLDLAMALAKPHKILMLDEPVAGVNPKLREIIKKIILRLKKKGETLLIIEHDMNFIMDLANYVFVLDAGTCIAEGKPKAIQNNKKVLEAYLGDSSC